MQQLFFGQSEHEFVTESSILRNAGQYRQIRDRMTRLSCLLGSARGTTRSISVHAEEGERRYFQHCALFDNFVGSTASLIMMRFGRVPGTLPLLVAHTRIIYTCTASSASLPLLAAVLVPKIQQQQSFLSTYRSEVIEYFLVPGRVCSYCCRF